MQTVNSPPWPLLELEYGFEAGLGVGGKGLGWEVCLPSWFFITNDYSSCLQDQEFAWLWLPGGLCPAAKCCLQLHSEWSGQDKVLCSFIFVFKPNR